MSLIQLPIITKLICAFIYLPVPDMLLLTCNDPIAMLDGVLVPLLEPPKPDRLRGLVFLLFPSFTRPYITYLRWLDVKPLSLTHLHAKSRRTWSIKTNDVSSKIL